MSGEILDDVLVAFLPGHKTDIRMDKGRASVYFFKIKGLTLRPLLLRSTACLFFRFNRISCIILLAHEDFYTKN